MTINLEGSPSTADAIVALADGHSIEMETLLRIMHHADEALSAGATAWVGAVYGRDQRGWYLVGTTVRVGSRAPFAGSAEIRLRNLALLSKTVSLSEFAGREAFLSAIYDWPQFGEVVPRPSLQSSVYARWESSQSNESGWPQWVVDVPSPGGDRHPEAPKEPFFDSTSGFFAENVQAATGLWMGVELSDSSWQHRPACFVYLPDRRARFSDITVEENEVLVSVEAGGAAELFCCGTTFGPGNREMKHVVRVSDGRAILRSADVIKSYKLHLLDGTGSVYDLVDTRYLDSWPLGFRPRRSVDRPPTDVELLTADAFAGESDTVEFKEWLPHTAGTDKFKELPRTVVGFANQRGGRIYIGVTDDGEVVGLARALKKHVAPSAKVSEIEALQSYYVRSLRKAVAEGVEPPVEVDFTWIDRAGLLVLRVTVKQGTQRPHFSLDTNEAFIRMNATTRRASPTDLRPFFAGDGRLLSRATGGIRI